MRAPGLLRGIRVLDLGIWRPAPFATQLLAELGAEVTKIEPPGGDPMHVFPSLYRSLNHAKAVIERDLKDPDQRESVLGLVADMDVVVEGYRPGVADRLGVGFDAARARNPSIIYCSVSGYGQTGPLAGAPGHDLNYQAWTGFLAARTPEINRSGTPVGDLSGGAYAALAVCAAIAGRERQPGAVHVDVSMADVLLSWAGPEIGGELASTDDPGAGFPGYGTFACADGHITLGIVAEDPFWTALCATLDMDDVSTLDVHARAARGPELRARIEAAVAHRPRDELVRVLLDAGVPVAPVLAPRDAVRAAPFVARDTVSVDDGGEVTLAHPVQYSR
jgi:crotonobetainyl-CoA:carnitine CoA-transferase CaiB-like acyl-CoA transferase